MGLLSRLHRFWFALRFDASMRIVKPIRTLQYHMMALREQLEDARAHMAAATAAERRLALQATDAERAAEQWTQRARRAVEYREDALAREALRRLRTAKELAEYYHQAHTRQNHTVVGLRTALKRLEMRLLACKAKRAHLLAKLDASQAQRLISRSLRQAVGADAFETFDRVAFQLDSAVQQALALTELLDDPDEAFVMAECDHHVERELTVLKHEYGCRPTAHMPRAVDERGTQ